MLRSLLALSAILTMTAALGADNWPAWRGPDGMGHAAETKLPLTWGPNENVRWKVPLPEAGNSTPVVWGDKIFLTQAQDQGKRRGLMCLSRADGKVLWTKEVTYEEKESTHRDNPYCSASPATDGQRVIVSHGSAGMYCYDFAGKELWQKDIGKMEHIWGNASSPIIHGDLAILWVGPGDRQILLAVGKSDGKTVWEHPEPGGSTGKDGGKSWIGSWSTPIIVKAGDHEELILGVPDKVKGFDPKTGKELWSCGGLTKLVYTSPLYADGVVVAMSGFGGSALGVKIGGTGDITKDRLWHHPKNSQRVGSGVIVGEHVYILEENGTPHCYELKTGKEIWQADQRAGATSWGSMVAADGRLYVLNQNGDTVVFAANPKYELLAHNRLNEQSNSSIAVSNGDLFIRTYKHLWCINHKK